ncbi:hypothetical protein J4442_02095 [Candidatus Woesearchaeota archaeon]|nr:hypothetical protein [Candidatus Woesearchaeota archaeon]
MGFSDLLKKGTGADYLNKEKKSNSQSKGSAKAKPIPQDDRFLRSLEQTLKKVNDEVEDMLEKVRVRRGL